MCKLFPVMKMKTNKEILSGLLKTTQMGQLGIRSVLDTGMGPELRDALRDQLRKYDAIETEAHTLASARGWEPEELDPALRFMTDMAVRMRLNGSSTDSRIADMMIRGNTKGLVKEQRALNHFPAGDEPLRTLTQRLLDCEKANIRQMQTFL